MKKPPVGTGGKASFEGGGTGAAGWGSGGEPTTPTDQPNLPEVEAIRNAAYVRMKPIVKWARPTTRA